MSRMPGMSVLGAQLRWCLTRTVSCYALCVAASLAIASVANGDELRMTGMLPLETWALWLGGGVFIAAVVLTANSPRTE